MNGYRFVCAHLLPKQVCAAYISTSAANLAFLLFIRIVGEKGAGQSSMSTSLLPLRV